MKLPKHTSQLQTFWLFQKVSKQMKEKFKRNITKKSFQIFMLIFKALVVYALISSNALISSKDVLDHLFNLFKINYTNSEPLHLKNVIA